MLSPCRSRIRRSSGPLVQTRGTLNVTDLDIAVAPTGGPGINVFPTSTALDRTATPPIDLSPTTININLANTAFNSGVTGSLRVTAGDRLANGISGVLDSGVPGSDGAWDDPGSTGILNNATADLVNLSMTSPLTAPATVSGVINASIPSNVTIPNVVTGTILVDLQFLAPNARERRDLEQAPQVVRRGMAIEHEGEHIDDRDPTVFRVNSLDRIAGADLSLVDDCKVDPRPACLEKGFDHRGVAEADPQLEAGKPRLRDDQPGGANAELVAVMHATFG